MQNSLFFVFKTSTFSWILTNKLNNPALAGVFPLKTQTTKLKLNQAKNTFVLFPCSPIKIWGKSVKVLVRFNRTYKQTNKHPSIDYNLLYINKNEDDLPVCNWVYNGDGMGFVGS